VARQTLARDESPAGERGRGRESERAFYGGFIATLVILRDAAGSTPRRINHTVRGKLTAAQSAPQRVQTPRTAAPRDESSDLCTLPRFPPLIRLPARGRSSYPSFDIRVIELPRRGIRLRPRVSAPMMPLFTSAFLRKQGELSP